MRTATKPFASLCSFLLAFAFALALSGALPAYADMSVGEMAADEAAQAPAEKVLSGELNLIQSGRYESDLDEVALKAQDDECAITDAQAEALEAVLSTDLSNWDGVTLDNEYGGILIEINDLEIQETDGNNKRVKEIVRDYIDSHPELFYLSGSYHMRFYSWDDVHWYFASIVLSLSYDVTDIPAMREAYAERINEAISWVGDIENAPDIKKVKAVHDFLVRTCCYNDPAADAGGPNGFGSYDPWNAYGALVRGEPVCQGYSLAFKACMDEYGIDCVCISQWIGESGHEWNKVKLDGSWYNLDVTWDDNLTDDKGTNHPERTPSVRFFLKSDAWFKDNPGDKGFHGGSTEWLPANVIGDDARYDNVEADYWPEFDGSLSSAAVKSFELTANTLEMVVGETETVQINAYTPAWLNPAFVAGQASWSTADGAYGVITVNDAGVITAEAPGTATAVCTIGELQQTCDVKVLKGRLTADNTTIALSTSQYSYDGTEREPDVTVMFGNQELNPDSDYTVNYSNNTNAGNATVTITAKGDYTGTVTTTFEIAPAEATPTLSLSEESFVYNGEVQKPIVTVKLGDSELDPSGYEATFSTDCTSAGSHEVTVSLKGNYSGSATATFEIAPVEVTPTIVLSKSSLAYNGKVQKPTVTVKVGEKSLATSEYDVAFAEGCIEIGTYQVLVSLKGNYSGAATAEFEIVIAKVTPTVTLSKASFVYNGKVQKPAVTVKVNGTKLSSSSYTAAFSTGCKAVGSYKVTVKLKGNYSGSKAVTFKILPKGTSISTLTAQSRGFTVKWAKQATQTTGYQVQYSLKSTFKSPKTLTITKTKTVSKKVIKLKAKKKYFVRVRTYKKVGTVKYYSAWSKAKAVTTKA